MRYLTQFSVMKLEALQLIPPSSLNKRKKLVTQDCDAVYARQPFISHHPFHELTVLQEL